MKLKAFQIINFSNSGLFDLLFKIFLGLFIYQLSVAVKRKTRY